jgi:hypothetical protein
VPTLAELQRGIRESLTSGGSSGLEALLAGGLDPVGRLAIHQRHYRVTLASSLLSRFPATAWLVGADFVRAAADTFVAAHPPSRPCIAEYGETFPAYLAARPAARAFPYLEQFATLEWNIARISLAIDHAPLTAEQLQALGPDALTDASLSLQPGVHYARVGWSIDELFSAYLADEAPERFELVPGPFDLEIRGARGGFTLSRLAPGVLMFRAALASGRSVGEAIAQTAAIELAFDAKQAVLDVIASGLIAGVHPARVTARSTP